MVHLKNLSRESHEKLPNHKSKWSKFEKLQAINFNHNLLVVNDFFTPND